MSEKLAKNLHYRNLSIDLTKKKLFKKLLFLYFSFCYKTENKSLARNLLTIFIIPLIEI